MAREFTLPDLGEGITEAQIIRVLIKSGETVSLDQALMEVETDKAAVEIPSPFEGVADKVHVTEGQTVNVGDVIVTFGGQAGKSSGGTAKKAAPTEAAQTEPAPTSAPATTAPATTTVAAPPAAPSTPRRTTTPAAPAVRKLARQMGIDLDTVTGTGPGGRVTKDDLMRVNGSPAAPAAPAVPAASPGVTPAPTPRPRVQPTMPLPGVPGTDKWGPIRRDKITQIRKTIANQMSLSAFTAVHVTHNDEVDVAELDSLRRELSALTDNDPKLTVMTFVIRATCLAIRKFPIFNASFDQENSEIIYKDYVNLGIAVDTERGLIVPVIRNVDTLGLRDIAYQLRAIAERIRTNQFAIEDLRGGTFTITNVGALGGSVSTPIINYPEVAILGLGRSKWTPVIDEDGEIDKGLMLPMNLSFDHRATDGANAARFCGEIISYLRHPSKFLLD